MAPQVQPKCFWHAQHMINKWQLKKTGLSHQVWSHGGSILKKGHKTAKIPALQKLTHKCRRQIVPLAMFYFSIDSKIKTSESARKCRLFLWTFLQSVSCIEYMWYGRCRIVREQFVCTQSIWKRYSWNFEKQMRLLGYFCQLPTTLQPENNHIIVLQFFEMEAEKKIFSFWTPSLWHSQRCRQLGWMKCLLQVRYRFRGL